MSGTWAEMVGMAGGWLNISLSLHTASLGSLNMLVVTVHTWQLASPSENTSPRVIMGDIVHGWGLFRRHATTGIYKPSIFHGLICDVSSFMRLRWKKASVNST